MIHRIKIKYGYQKAAIADRKASTIKSFDSRESFFPLSSGRYSILLTIRSPEMKVKASRESIDFMEFQ